MTNQDIYEEYFNGWEREVTYNITVSGPNPNQTGLTEEQKKKEQERLDESIENIESIRRYINKEGIDEQERTRRKQEECNIIISLSPSSNYVNFGEIVPPVTQPQTYVGGFIVDYNISGTGNNPTITIKSSNEAILSWYDESNLNGIDVQFTVKVKPSAMSLQEGIVEAKYSVSTTIGSYSGNCYKEYGDVSIDSYNGTAYPYPGYVTAKYTVVVKPKINAVVWTWETDADLEAYAELVANEVGVTYTDGGMRLAQDWNVMSGIPSTENLSVAAGGTAWQISMGGYIYNVSFQEAPTDTENEKHGVYYPKPAATRTITFKVLVNDWWGQAGDKNPVDANHRCRLSCGGHTSPALNGKPNIPRPTEVLDGSADLPDVPWQCTHCDAEDVYTYTPGTDCPDHGGVCAGGIEVIDVHGVSCSCGGSGSHEEGESCTYVEEVKHNCVGSTKGSWSGEHTCSCTVTFYCDNGKTQEDHFVLSTSMEGMTDANVSVTTGSLAYNQNYSSGFAIATTPKGQTTQTPVPGNGLLCEGYTYWYGCQDPGTPNCVHRSTVSRTYKIVQQLDNYAYRTITDAKVYGLQYSELTDVNTEVLSSEYLNRRAVNIGLFCDMWRCQTSGWDINDDAVPDIYNEYRSGVGNGRFIFTPFTEPRYTSGKTGWIGTSCYLNAGGTSYFLGDCTVQISVYADFSAVDFDLANEVAVKERELSDRGTVESHIDNRGHSSTRYDVCDTHCIEDHSSSHEYKSNAHTGDVMSSNQITVMALYLIDEWFTKNEGHTNTINVINDAFAVGVRPDINDKSTWKMQNVFSEAYAVDDGSIDLFNFLFSGSSDTIYRTHIASRTSDTMFNYYQSSNADYNWRQSGDKGDSLIQAGYNGVNSSNPLTKYSSSEKVETVKWYQTLCQGMRATLNGDPASQYISSFWRTFAESKPNMGLILYNKKNSYAIQGSSRNHLNEVDLDKNDSSGYTEYRLDVKGDDNPETFKGIYNEYYYDTIGDYVINNLINDKKADLGLEDDGVEEIKATDAVKYSYVGTGNPNGTTSVYYTPMSVSNLIIKEDCPNGTYSEVATMENHFMLLLNIHQFDDVYDRLKTLSQSECEIECTYRPGYRNQYNHDNVINDILIWDPISVEYSQIISNGIEPYADYVENTIGDDMRSNMIDKDESSKADYVVVGNEFHLWVSDYYDVTPTGSRQTFDVNGDMGTVESGDSHEYNTGEVVDGAFGYGNALNTGRWVGWREVVFSFPVLYTDLNGNQQLLPPGEPVNLDNVAVNTVRTTKNGNAVINTDRNNLCYVRKDYDSDTGYDETSGNVVTYGIGGYDKVDTAFQYGSDILQDFKPFDEEFVWGLDYCFRVPISCPEVKSATVKVRAFTINNTLEEDKANGLTTVYDDKHNIVVGSDEGFSAPYAVEKVMNINIVGRIGGLSITDVEDPAYSNLFKAPITDDWLIEGVVEKVNYEIPSHVLASVGNGIFKHHDLETSSTVSSITNMYENSGVKDGKQGTLLNLPLTASLNNISELNKSQVELGYNIYMDIETIGEYHGINEGVGHLIEVIDPNTGEPRETVSTVSLTGPTSSEEEFVNSGIPDERKYKMVITPYYYLYSPSAEKYIAINMYHGKQGSYQLYYTPDSIISRDSTSLFVDMYHESDRRVVSSAEERITQKVLNKLGTSISAFSDKDYIGTASKIVLDQYNRTYIGTSIYDGLLSCDTPDDEIRAIENGESWTTYSYNENGNYGVLVSETDFMDNVQRWHFTLGLPSSTYITYAGAGDAQLDIEASHDKLMSDYPDAVIVCFIDIKVNGMVYELQYDYSKYRNSNEFQLYNNNELPEDFTGNNMVSYDNCPVYTESGMITNYINKMWAPVLVYDAWASSTEDLGVKGSH